MSCSGSSVPTDGGTTGPRCVVQPVAKVGEPCGTVADAGTSYVSCESGLSCQYVAGTDGGASSSHCVQPGDVGAACQSRSACKTGLTCDSTTQKCAQPAAIGATCTPFDSSSCATGAYCDSTSKKCTALPGAGSACLTNTYPVCSPDSTCDSATKKCVAKKSNGQPCTSSSECASAYCGGSATSTVETCGADPGIASPETCAVANGGAPPG